MAMQIGLCGRRRDRAGCGRRGSGSTDRNEVLTVAIPKTVVITGASSGIGEALALRYASAGGVLGVTGRDRGRLERVAERCRVAGCEVDHALIDVCDRAALAEWLRTFDRRSPVDLVIANAGVMTGSPIATRLEEADGAFQLMQINVLGMLNTVHPLLPLMVSRGRGQIAVMSSVSALAPLPDAPSYSASKAAVLSYGVALRDGVRATGVRVSVICPGYVTSPMTDHYIGWKPFEMTAEAAAERIARGLARDRAIVAFPWPLVLMARSSRWLPDSLRRLAMRPFKFHVSGA
jgi:short-subunit dehydrogenase